MTAPMTDYVRVERGLLEQAIRQIGACGFSCQSDNMYDRLHAALDAPEPDFAGWLRGNRDQQLKEQAACNQRGWNVEAQKFGWFAYALGAAADAWEREHGKPPEYGRSPVEAIMTLQMERKAEREMIAGAVLYVKHECPIAIGEAEHPECPICAWAIDLAARIRSGEFAGKEKP